MNWKTTVGVCLLSLSLSGCMSVYRVSSLDKAKPNGIPFYSKTAVCQHQTVYLNPYFRVSLKVSSGEKVFSSESVNLDGAVYRGIDMANFLKEYNKDNRDQAELAKLWDKVKMNNIDPYLLDFGKAHVAANTSAVATLVDYMHPYTLNAKSPLAGSAKITFKLADDGTLTESTGEVTDNTLSTILSALPIADLIKGAAGGEMKLLADGKTYELKVEQRFIKTTYSAYDDLAIGCTAKPQLTTGNLTVDDIGADSGADKSKSKDDKDDSISFSGSVKLPKAAAASGKPGPKDAEATPDKSVTANTDKVESVTTVDKKCTKKPCKR